MGAPAGSDSAETKVNAKFAKDIFPDAASGLGAVTVISGVVEIRVSDFLMLPDEFQMELRREALIGERDFEKKLVGGDIDVVRYRANGISSAAVGVDGDADSDLSAEEEQAVGKWSYDHARLVQMSGLGRVGAHSGLEDPAILGHFSDASHEAIPSVFLDQRYLANVAQIKDPESKIVRDKVEVDVLSNIEEGRAWASTESANVGDTSGCTAKVAFGRVNLPSQSSTEGAQHSQLQGARFKGLLGQSESAQDGDPESDPKIKGTSFDEFFYDGDKTLLRFDNIRRFKNPFLCKWGLKEPEAELFVCSDAADPMKMLRFTGIENPKGPNSAGDADGDAEATVSGTVSTSHVNANSPVPTYRSCEAERLCDEGELALLGFDASKYGSCDDFEDEDAEED